MSKDPDEWIAELELTRSRIKKMGTEIDESYLMMHVLNNMPSAYENLIDTLEDRLDSATDPLTIENLREKLSEKYEKIKAKKKFRQEDSDSEEEERALFDGSKFKGCCHYCDKFGHKAAKCNKKKNDEESKKPNQGNNRRFNGKCNFCGKFGHKEAQCWEKHGKPGEKKETGDDNANQAIDRDHEEESVDEEIALICYEINGEEEKGDLAGVVLEGNDQWSKEPVIAEQTIAFGSTQNDVEIDREIWIGDTGASSHMTHSKEGMTNMRPSMSWIIFGNGQRLQSTHIGDKHGFAVQREGKRTKITIRNVKYVPDFFCNIFSIPTALENGCILEGSKNKLVIKKDSKEYFFDHKIKSGKGVLFGIKISTNSSYKDKKQPQRVSDIMKYHEHLGHASEAMTRSTASRMNVKLKGNFTYCDGCSQGKMRQKNISKKKIKQSEIPGERLFLDISSIKYTSLGGARFWVLMMDDCSGYLTSFF